MPEDNAPVKMTVMVSACSRGDIERNAYVSGELDKQKIETVLYYGKAYDDHWPLRVKCQFYDWHGNGKLPLNLFINWLNSLVASVPTEFKDNISIEIDSKSGYEDYHSADMRVSWWRLETDVELAVRLERFKQQESTKRSKQEEKDLEVLRKLKERYPGA